MSRIRIGQFVRVRDTIVTVHVNKIGVVLKVVPNKRRIRTLDRYVVGLPGGVEINLWDIQVEPAESASLPSPIGLEPSSSGR